MLTQPKISILIPCYNVDKYLDQCIESVLNQTLKEIEIICINDGSTDKTLEIIKKYKNLDSRIEIIDKENTGYGDSMNRALDKAQGEYIAIVESDDFIEPDMFQTLYETACCENTQITRSCYYEYKNGLDTVVTNDWVPKNYTHNPNIVTAAYWQAPAIWAAIYNRRWLNENNIRFLRTPGASYQDTSFIFKCYACCDRFIMIDKVFLHYRIDNQSNSVNSSGKAYCVCDEWREIYNFVKSNQQRFNHLQTIMPKIQYGTYIWNFRRLTGKIKFYFLLHWILEWTMRLLKREIKFCNILTCIKK